MSELPIILLTSYSLTREHTHTHTHTHTQLWNPHSTDTLLAS
jgi:hypothetical protein